MSKQPSSQIDLVRTDRSTIHYFEVVARHLKPRGQTVLGWWLFVLVAKRVELKRCVDVGLFEARVPEHTCPLTDVIHARARPCDLTIRLVWTVATVNVAATVIVYQTAVPQFKVASRLLASAHPVLAVAEARLLRRVTRVAAR
jgi:hypothetical protein